MKKYATTDRRIIVPYIPTEHEQYNLLPLCRKAGCEVFDYPSKLLYETEQLLGSSEGLFPYNFDSYEDYFASIDALIAKHSADSVIVQKLLEVRETVVKMNCKEEWSILKHIGPSDDSCLGLTNGKNYYWPTQKKNPVYCGVIDDEEFTAYLYPTEPRLWEILLDPTGMAYRTIYQSATGYLSQSEYDDFMMQLSDSDKTT